MKKPIIGIIAAALVWFGAAAAFGATVTHTHNSCSGNHGFVQDGTLTGHANTVARYIYPYSVVFQGHYTRLSPGSPWQFQHSHQTSNAIVCW